MSSVAATPSAASPRPAAPVAPATGQPAAAPLEAPPLRSAMGEVIPTRRVVVNGLAGAANGAAGLGSRFSRDASFDGFQATGAGAVARGFLRVEATPLPAGARLHVQTFHMQHNEQLTLYLLAEVLDLKTNQLRPITLSVLTQAENLNHASFRGNTYFDIAYDDLNRYLKARNPNLEVVPGHTTLAVAARWGNNGHQAGGFSRGGTFRLPGTGALRNVVSIRNRELVTPDLPLDMEVAYTPQLVKEIPQLKTDGNIVSRLESELKGVASGPAMAAATRRMYDLAYAASQGNQAAVARVLGKDWTVSTVNRYWLKDTGAAHEPGKAGTGFFAGFRVDGDGLPIQDPMRDTYMDDASLGMTKAEGAIRLRKNNTATVINVKPGGGRRDNQSSIVQRIEVGLELKAEASVTDAQQALRTLAYGQWSGTVYNHAQREVTKLNRGVNLQNALDPWIDIVQDRHKFTVKNEKTGVEVELSFDRVSTKTLRPEHNQADGSPRRAEFFVLEAELDHLQLGSANQNTNVLAGGTPNVGSFSKDAEQDQWLKATSDQVTTDIDPRLHELKDLDNESFRATASYKSFEDLAKKLVPALFPEGLTPGRQKAAYAAERMGLVFASDQALVDGLRSMVSEAGFTWSPALAAAVQQIIADPARRRTLEAALVSGQQRNMVNLLRNVAPTVALEYDLARVKARLKSHLTELGLASTAEIDALVDKLTVARVPPANLESALQQMANVQDAQVMQQLAAALGVTPPPAPKANVQALLGDSTYGRLIKAALVAVHADLSQAGDVEKFLAKAAEAGATSYDVRALIRGLGSTTQERLNQLAQSRNLLAEVPKIRASVDKLVELAAQQLKGHSLVVDAPFRDFLKAVAQGRTLQQAVELVQGLGADPRGRVTEAAARLGVAAPQLAFDQAAVEATLKPILAARWVAYDTEMKTFVHAALTAGVPVAQLQRAFGGLASTRSLESALKAGSIYVVGATIPTLRYDLAAAARAQRQALAAYAGALAADPAMSRFVETLLAAGLTEQQINSYTTTMATSGRQQAQRHAPGVALASLPPLPVDAGALCQTLKARFGAAWKPEHEQYVKAAYPKAEQAASFALGQIYNNTLPQVLAILQQHSGVARPAGV